MLSEIHKKKIEFSYISYQIPKEKLHGLHGMDYGQYDFELIE